MVRAMRPTVSALTEWSEYSDALTTDEELEPALEATLPAILHLWKETASAVNADYDALAQAADGDAELDELDEPRRGNKKSRKAQKAAEMRARRPHPITPSPTPPSSPSHEGPPRSGVPPLRPHLSPLPAGIWPPCVHV